MLFPWGTKFARAKWRLGICLGLGLLWVGIAQAATADFTGGYNGTGRANGMAMILEQTDGRVYGRIVDGQRNVFQVSGQVNGTAVQGTISNQASAANFQIELKPTGLKVVIIPVVGGQPDLGAMKQLVFERGRVSNPALADYRTAAPRGENADVFAFLEKYRGWSREEVAATYSSMSEKDRAAINQYDHVQADIMNRLCRTKADKDALRAASKGESWDCRRLVAAFDGAGRSIVTRFYDEAEVQRSALYTQLACERGIYGASRCRNRPGAPKTWQDASRLLADAGQTVSAASSPTSVADGAASEPHERSGVVAFYAQSQKTRLNHDELLQVGQKTNFPELDLTLRPSSGVKSDP